MSDANEREFNDLGRKPGKPGMTKGASLSSGLSEHSQITAGPGALGMAHGQGQRPKKMDTMTMTHGGKKFKTK